LGIINPGENFDSNLPDFVVNHHCIFWVTRFSKSVTLRFGEIRQSLIVVYHRSDTSLFDGNRTIKLAVCDDRRRDCLWAQVNADAASLCATITRAVAAVIWFKTKRITTAK
jgi:hypothetical protein